VRAELVDILRCPRSGAALDLVALERNGDEVEAGILRGPAGDYPIVAGIPILDDDLGDVVARVRSGDHATATALAVGRGVKLSRLDELVPGLLALRPSRPVARWLSTRHDRLLADRAGRAVSAAAADPDPLLRFTHLEGRYPNAEGYRYFRYRLGLPRHLVALGAVAASRPPERPVVEIGCGAGHLTWQLALLLAPRRVIGVDREFDLLWAARHHIATDADLVCADATALPLADGVGSLGVAVDVLSFVRGKAVAARELHRVTGSDGALVLTSLINAAARHEFAGDPLPVEAWAGLAGGRPCVPFADLTVLDHYLDRRCPPRRPDDAATLGAARTITLAVGEAALAGLGDPLDDWPHALGRLGPHPMLVPEPPSDLDRYLPATMCLEREVVDAARAGARPAGIEPFIDCAAVLGHPPRWPADPWTTATGPMAR
jgi:SAM-dependent methyltransferase